MIVPSDQHLIENISFYDPTSKRIFFSANFWKHFFSHLLSDFKKEKNQTVKDVGKFGRAVKRAIFDYYYNRYVLRTTNTGEALYGAFVRIFNEFADVEEDFELVDHSRLIVPISQPQSTGYVDQLCDQYAGMARDSMRELNLQVTYDQFATQHANEDAAIPQIQQDFQSGKFDLALSSDSGFNMVLDTAMGIFNHYEGKFGLVTIFNMLRDRSEDMAISNKNFDVLFFSTFYKAYSRYECFTALIRELGYDQAEQLYNHFMSSAVFLYQNVHEYVFSSMFLYDLYKRSLLVRHDASKGWIGCLSTTKRRTSVANSSGFGTLSGTRISGLRTPTDESGFSFNASSSSGFGNSKPATTWGSSTAKRSGFDGREDFGSRTNVFGSRRKK